MHPRTIANLNGTWEIPDNLDVSNFDFNWRPSDLLDPPFIHQFGTQWQKTGGPRYVVSGSTQIKYVDTQRAIALPNKSRNWRGAEDIEFDYSWHPDDTDPPFIYQFATQWQKRGGPRYVVPGATQVKYVEYPRAKKLPNMKNWDILYDDIDTSNFDFSWHPDDTESGYKYIFGSEYYSPEEMPCITYRNGNEKYIYNIKVKFKPIDIIFMSNGETGEQERYDALCEYSKRKVKWVRGINGRENAIKKCTEISETEWVLVFPAKLKIYPTFDFNWQPNRNGKKRHFIFYADNPVNGLCYGHMAPVAYHRDIVLNTVDYGLDFTMSGAHDIVPISAGIAEYNADPLMTWRTAFREVLKLKVNSDNNDSESEERLNIWLNVANGQNSEYSLLGAKHAIEYYDEVNGDLEKLQNSFSWEWMDKKYKSIFK